MREYKYSIMGSAVALVFYAASVIIDLDVFEALIHWLERVDHIEVDEMIIAFLPLCLGLATDIFRHRAP
jgi:hypothetical protein